MKWNKTLQVIDVHCEGEVGKVITSGVVDLPGKTMMEKMQYINTQDDSLIKFLLLEPRGCAQMAVNLVLPPISTQAHAGFLVLLPDGAHSMSGSNCMCVVTALLETGTIPMVEPITEVMLDTPTGLITARAECNQGKCTRVTLNMPPAFVEALNISLHTVEFGEVNVDIAFGGEYYALLDIAQFGINIAPCHASELVQIGMKLKEEITTRIKVQHPEIPSINTVASVMFRCKNTKNTLQTCTVGGTGRVDRSPCGTGNAANLAVLHATGELLKGEHIIAKSIIGSEFDIALLDETNIGTRPGIQASVSGRSWIYGIHQLGMDPDDPFKDGFMLSDTWGPNIRAK